MTEVSSQPSDVYVKLARKLSHVDREVRMAGLDSVRAFLRSRRNLGHEEMMKLWTGLFYCMWHADKPLVQQELARSLSGLLLEIGWHDALSFYACFAETMCRKWQGIDRLRLDKFYDLCRCFTQEMLRLLSTHRWEAEIVSAFVGQLNRQILHGTSLAMTLHLIDYWVSDLTEVASPVPNAMLEPIMQLLATTGDDGVIKRILENIVGKAATLPNLDVKAFGNECFTVGSDPSTPQRNRKALYKAHRELRGEIVGPVEPPKSFQFDKRIEPTPKPKKRASQKIARALEIDSVIPHLPMVAPSAQQEEAQQDGVGNVPSPKPKKRKKQKMEAVKQVLEEQQVPQGQALQLQAKLQKLKDLKFGASPRSSNAQLQHEVKPTVKRAVEAEPAAEHDVVTVRDKKAKPSPQSIVSMPSPPKMMKAKRAPISTGKSVKFALDKNEVHTFQRNETGKMRRLSSFF